MLIVAYVVLCLLIGLVGRKRRIGFSGYFLLSVLFTPILTLLFILLSGLDLNPGRRPVSYSAVCKHCEMEARAKAKIQYCPSCGHSM